MLIVDHLEDPIRDRLERIIASTLNGMSHGSLVKAAFALSALDVLELPAGEGHAARNLSMHLDLEESEYDPDKHGYAWDHGSFLSDEDRAAGIISRVRPI